SQRLTHMLRSMPTDALALSGRCHCGNLEMRFETNVPVAELPLRACACSFCRHHGARTTSDPAGSVQLTAHEPNLLNRYQFGRKTFDAWLGHGCGVYLAAVMTDGGRRYAALNVNSFEPGIFSQPPARVDYENETLEERRERRLRAWTPVLD